MGSLPVAGSPVALDVGDFDRDGRQDLAVANGIPNNLATPSVRSVVFLGLGGGTFQPARTFAAAGGPSSLLARDFDSDGVLDLVSASYYLDDVSFLPGGGDGTFGRP